MAKSGSPARQSKHPSVATLALLASVVMFALPWAGARLGEAIAATWEGLRWVGEHPQVPCAMAAAGCAELIPTAGGRDAGDGCPPPSVSLEGGCWFEAKGPPCLTPAELKQGKCYVLHRPPMPNAGSPGHRPIGR